MIGFLKGNVFNIQLDHCLLDVNGVGYRVYIAESTRLQLEEGKEAMLYTYLNVREDIMQLYGFLTEAEYDLFTLLISVSGIGPKVGMGILSGMSPQTIRMAIATADTKTLIKLPGIGKKSAERLVLELKDKIGNIPVDSSVKVNIPSTIITRPRGVKEEVLEALKALGYAESEVLQVIEVLEAEHQEVETLLRATLAELGKKR